MKLSKKRVRKHSLRTNILMFFIVSILVCFSVGIYNYMLQNKSLQEMSRLMNESRQLGSISADVNALQNDVDGYLKTRSSDRLQSYYSNRNVIMEDANLLAAQADFTDHGIKLKNLSGMLLYHLDVTERVLTSKRNEKVNEYIEGYDYALNSYNHITAYIQEILAGELQESALQYEKMQNDIKLQSVSSYSLFAISFILIISMIFLYSYQITKPLARLADYASRVSEGDYDVIIENKSSDIEFEKLYDAFSVMLENTRLYLSSLNEKRYLERQLSQEKIKSLEMKASLQEAEYLALRSQMNPHFIFNTINIGAKIAMLEGDDKVCEYLEDAADVFRYTMQGLNEATLEEEIENANTYMNLLTARFGEKLQFTCFCDENVPVSQLIMPRMTLQPLVENAYMHGVGKNEKGGKIHLDIRRKNKDVQISVIDSGGQFPPGKITEVLEKARADIVHTSPASSGTGIGLINVIKRIQLFYQNDHLFQIESGGLETKVEFTIPCSV